MAFIGLGLLKLLYFGSLTLIIYGIPWDILISFHAMLSQSLFNLYLLYFYLICYYLKLKLRRNHQRLIEITKSENCLSFNHVMKLVFNLDRVYHEIKQINTEFWSFQIVINLIFNFVMFSCQLYILFFVEIDLVFNIVCVYFLLLNFFVFLLLISSSASVTSLANKQYHLLNKLFIVKNKQLNRLSRIKVQLI